MEPDHVPSIEWKGDIGILRLPQGDGDAAVAEKLGRIILVFTEMLEAKHLHKECACFCYIGYGQSEVVDTVCRCCILGQSISHSLRENLFAAPVASKNWSLRMWPTQTNLKPKLISSDVWGFHIPAFHFSTHLSPCYSTGNETDYESFRSNILEFCV